MFAVSKQPGSTESPAGLCQAGTRDARYHLLRLSHIFGSAVREMLEARLLRAVSRFPLSLSQLYLLKLMSRDGRHGIREVADFLGVSSPAASKNIDKLQRLGLVVRGRSAGDRRAVRLLVSPKGRRLVRRHEARKAARLSQALNGFQAWEIEQLVGLLERFSVSLLDLEPGADRSCLRCAGYVETDCPVADVRGGCPCQRTRPEPPQSCGGRTHTAAPGGWHGDAGRRHGTRTPAPAGRTR
jgi:DNA-binding MarR family transcriptional regulator